MGGFIGVDSEPGKGSLFYFEIPVQLSTEPGKIVTESRFDRIIGLAQGQQYFRLLIVEDKKETRLLLRKILEPLGFEIKEAVNGQEAVEAFIEWQPHLIWMDIRLPVMNGKDATRQIRKLDSGRNTKIVALTAHALEEERREILEAGCDDFIRKPFRESEILEALEKHLSVRFEYSNEPETQPPASEKNHLDIEHFSALNPDLIYQLHEATLLLDMKKCLEISNKIGEVNKITGTRLLCMINNLQYREILEITGQLVGEQHP